MTNRITRVFVLLLLGLLPAHYAQAQDIPGDGTTTTRLAVPGTFDSDIDSASDQDGFLVGLISGGTYQIDAEATSGLLDTAIGLFPPGQIDLGDCLRGPGLLVSNDDGGSGTDSRITHTATQTGDHLLCIRGVFSFTGNYQLTAAVTSESPTQPSATISAPDTFIAVAETALNGTTLTVTLDDTEYETSPTAGQFTLNLSAGTGVTVSNVARDSATAATLTLAYTDSTGINANTRIGVTVAAAAHTSVGDLTTDNMLRVAATAPTFAGMQPIANQTYLANSAITDLTLPAASGGEGTLSYTLAPTGGGSLPNGLVFDADTRILSGTPDTEQAATGYTYTVTAGDGNTATLGFTIEVLNLATGLTAVRELAAPERRGRVVRIALTWLPPATVPAGTSVSSYEIQGCSAANTDCVAFITSNHIGAAGASQSATLFRATFNFYRVRARTAAGVSPWANVARTVDPGVVVDPGTLPSMVQNLASSARADNSVTLTWEAPTDAVSTAVNRYVVVRGFPAETATLGAFAPPGAEAVVTLADDVFTYADSGLLPGTEYLYEVFASSNAGDGEVAQLLVTTTGTLTTSIAGVATGAITEGATDSITGTLTITTTSGNSEFVAPVNSDGEEQLQFSTYGMFTISAAGVWTYSLNYNLPRVRALTEGQMEQDMFTVTAAAPTADGVAVTQVVTITITGVNTRPFAAIRLIDGSTVAAGETLRLESDITDPDNELDDLTIAWTAAGGIGTFSAAASADTDWMVPAATPPAEYLLTLTVTDPDPGSASDTEQVSITVTPPLPLEFGGETIDDQTYTRRTGITDLTLPVATGGTEPYSYALSGMPSGLAFDSDTRVLSGTPNAEQAATTYTYTATDAATPPATGTLAFTIEVMAPAPLSFGGATIADQAYEVGTTITNLTLPAATGGVPPLSYSIVGLNVSSTAIADLGLSFDSDTRILSGTPMTTLGSGPGERYRYIVSDGVSSVFQTFFNLLIRPAPPASATFVTDPLVLTEANLDGATLTVTLTGTTYEDPLPNDSITLNSAATDAGVTVMTSVRGSDTEATLTLTYDGTDFDTDLDIIVTVADAAHAGTGDLDTGTVTVTAIDEDVPGDGSTTVRLAVPGTFDSIINPDSDQDGFLVALVSGGAYQFDAERTGSSLDLDTTIGLYPPGQADFSGSPNFSCHNASGVLAGNDDFAGGRNSRITWTATQTGDHLLCVDAFGNNRGSGPYRVTAAVTSEPPAADNATLSALTLSGGATLTPDFAAGTLTYTADVANNVADIMVTPTATVAGATITVNGDAVTSGSASTAITLTAGMATDIDVLVTATDGSTTQTYNLAVTRAAAPTAAISDTVPDSLTEANLNGAMLTVTLTGTTYDDPLPANPVTLNTAATTAGVTVMTAVRDSDTEATLTLAHDASDFDTDLDIIVTVADAAHAGTGDLDTGTVTVAAIDEDDIPGDGSTTTRLAVPGTFDSIINPDSDQDGFLVALVSGGAYQFDAERTSGNLDTSLGLYPPGHTNFAGSDSCHNAAGVLVGNDDGGLSVSTDSLITWTATQTGDHLLCVDAFGTGGSSGPYRVTAAVTSEPPPAADDATLSALTLSGGATLTPDFAAGTFTYTADVDNSVADIMVTPTATVAGATITVNGDAVTSGSASTAITLTAGMATDIDVLVTATDGSTTQTYNLAVTRAAAPTAAISDTVPDSLTEANLDGATLTVTLTGTTYVNTLPANPVTLNAAATAAGVTVMTAVRDSVTEATLTLAHDGTDFDTDLDIIVTVADAAHAGTGDLDTGTVTVTAVAENNNANLSALTLSAGTLTPDFDAATTTYAAMVDNSVSSLTLTPTVANAFATIIVAGTAVTSGTASGSVELAEGPNAIAVEVTATDGSTTQTYTVTVTRAAAAASSNADLSALTLSAGTLTPVFDAATTTYTAIVENSVSSLTLTPTAADAGATITVDGVAADSGMASDPVDLDVGDNAIDVLVTAEDGSTMQTYNLAVTRRDPDIISSVVATGPSEVTATFSAPVSIVPSSDPNFAGSALNLAHYAFRGAELTTASLAQQTTVAANAAGTELVFTLLSGTSPANLDPAPGTFFNTLPSLGGVTDIDPASGNARVLGFGGTRQRVPWPLPDAGNAKLSALTLSGDATLTPAFVTGTFAYTADVANGVADIMVTPTATISGATITVQGNAVTSGSASGAIALTAGAATDVAVVITATDSSTTQTYRIAVTRAPAPTTAAISDTVPDSLTEANLDGATLTVTLTGTTYDDPLPANPVTLNTAATTAGVTVTAVRVSATEATLTLAHDGTDFDTDLDIIVTVAAAAHAGTGDLDTGTVTVTAVVENNNANLSALTLSAGTLTPDFDAATTTYAAMVDNSVSSLTLTPTVANAFATITVDGEAVASGMASGSVDLDEGPNAIVVEVTATDGSTMLTYTVTVTRAAAPTTTAAISATVPDPLTEANLDGATLTVTLTDTTYMDPLPANPVTLNTDATDAGVTVMTAVRDTATVATVTLDYDDTDFDTDLDIIVTVAAAAHVGSGDLLTAARTVTAIDETSRLSALSLSEGALDPVFNAGTFVYAASVANSIDGLTVTPAAAAGTTITVDGAPVNSGEASAELALTVGANTITVAVTTPKATAQDYTLTVTREMALSFGGADTGGVTEDTATTTATGTLTVTNPNPSGGTEVVAQTDADGTYGTFTIVAASGAWTYTLNNSAPATNALAASETVTDVFTVVAAADPGAITDVTITITGANDAPTADAGPPQAVALSATVTLDGSASADPDTGADPANADAIDSYAWTQTDSSGNTVTLDDATAVSPTFTAPSVPTTLEFSLVVNDGDADSAPATVTITVTGAPAATISATTPDPLTEANLNGATLTVTLTNTTYQDPLPANSIMLNAEATTAGVTATAARVSATEATLTLAFDRAASDFDTDLDITVTVAAAAHANAGDLDAGTVTATAIDESDVATLSALTLSGGVSLTPVFDAGTFTYTADVDNSVANIMVTPTATDDGATIEVQGTAVTSGSASTAITLTAGMATDIDVLVTAEDGSTTRTYNLAVTRAAALALSFGGETIDAQTYTVNTAIAGLTLPTASGGTAPYSYALSDVPSGLTFAAATRVLSGTPNAVQAATTYTYTATDAAVSPASVMLDLVITVNAVVVPTATISATTPATLTEANLDGATLTVTLTNTTYGNPLPADPITLDTAATTAGVTATAVRDSDTEATLTLAFDRAASDFDTDLDITVTVAAAAHANAGDLDAGTVTATAIDESDVATLSALTLSGGATLTPVFDAGTFTYTADVDNSVANIMVTPTATDGGATIEVQGTAVTSGAASTAITLTAGVATDIAVLVTAEDGTTQTYNLVVTRAAATTPTAAIATPSSLTEATLDGATVTVMLTNTEYVPGVLATNLFTVTLSGSGVTVSTAARTSAVLATLTLAYGGTGIDANTTLGITVLDAAHSGTGNLDTATIPVTATPPSLPGATFSVAENAAANTPVGTPLVPDNFPGGSQTWAIVSGNTGNDFAINPSTGQLTVAANDSINFEDTPSYTLMVSLTVGTTAMAQAAVTVTVSDVDEPPAAPAAPTVAPAAESLNVSWTAPANNGPAITRYDVQFRTGSDPFALASPGPGAATSLTITGLTANTAYEVQVRAANAEGDGAYSASGSGTPLAAGAPTATITTTAPTTLTEANLNGAMLTVTLTNATYVGTLTDSQFTLTGAPGTAMISVASVTGSGTQAVLVLAYPDAGADLDSDLNLSVVVDAAAHTGTNPLTTGAVAVADNAAPVISDPGLQSYVQNVLITPLMITVDDADGDAAGNPPTVTLTNLPNGLVFDGTNQVTGTPTELGDTVVTITAADGVNDMVTETFTITVTPSTGALRFGVALIPAQSYTVNTAITDLTLPAATGGTGPYGYSLSGMPSGLSFNAMTRVLSGTPDTEEGARAYTYTAVDSAISPAAVTLSLVITVNAPSTTLRFDVTTIPAQSYTVNAAITDLTLPAATGGTGTLSYTLSGMPSGLIFDAGTRVLSGTPDTEQMATTYTYTATDVTSPPAAVMLSLVITVRLEATGGPLEVARSEAMEMTLGAFGRSFTSSAVDVLGERFSSGVGGSQLTFGGRTLSLESLTNDQAAAGAEPDNQPVPAAAGGQQTSVGALFAGSAFQLSLNEGDAAGVGATTLWARGAVGNYEGEPEDGFQLDGDIVSGYLGLDYRASRRTLVGVAVSHSRGDADFSSAAIADGEVETELTSILPYVQWQPHAGLSLWGLVGYGLGESEITDSGASRKTDVEMQTAALGARGKLWSGGRADVALKASALTVEIESDSEQNLSSVTTRAHRLRMALAGNRHGAASARGGRFGQRFELGLRWDLGDVETGAGADLGAGVEYANPRSGTRLRLDGHYLLVHEESDFEAWEVSAEVGITPSLWGRGVRFALEPGWDSAGARQRMVMDFTDVLGPAWRGDGLKLELYGEHAEDHEFGLEGSFHY